MGPILHGKNRSKTRLLHPPSTPLPIEPSGGSKFCERILHAEMLNPLSLIYPAPDLPPFTFQWKQLHK